MVWYHVRDLEAARAFYKDKLGFEETYVDPEDLVRGEPDGVTETNAKTVDRALSGAVDLMGGSK